MVPSECIIIAGSEHQ